MNKRDQIIYYVATGLLTLNMLLSAGMYFFNYEMVADMIGALGYPTYIIYPLGIAKLLGLVAIWTKKSNMLKEWAYTGFVFDFLLAISAHLNVSDGQHWGAVVALVLVTVSYIYDRKLYGVAKEEQVAVTA